MKIGYEKFTIYEVEEVYKALNLELSSKQEIQIDLQGVQKIDMVAIQLLLSTHKTCQKDDKSFTLVNISSELQHTIDMVGCMPLLGTIHE
ncbi:MAG: STAS domain-containing protein [Sulfurimonadaceae bacterium]|jgi:anti-anti-sigma factor|nr:STAS domain-containing protein [Sulfurimonadaceae bacterium]